MKDIYLFGYLGLFASIVLGTGEFIICLNAISIDASVASYYFQGTTESSMSLGHFIIIPFLTFYVFGYWHLYLALKPGSFKLATSVLLLGLFMSIMGGVWVGARTNLGIIMQTLNEVNIPEVSEKMIVAYDLYLEKLVQILCSLVILISVCFSWAIIKGGTLYPRWMAFFNPILIFSLAFALFFFVSPMEGPQLYPIAINIAYFILFSTSLFALQKQKKKSSLWYNK